MALIILGVLKFFTMMSFAIVSEFRRIFLISISVITVLSLTFLNLAQPELLFSSSLISAFPFSKEVFLSQWLVLDAFLLVKLLIGRISFKETFLSSLIPFLFLFVDIRFSFAFYLLFSYLLCFDKGSDNHTSLLLILGLISVSLLLPFFTEEIILSYWMLGVGVFGSAYYLFIGKSDIPLGILGAGVFFISLDNQWSSLLSQELLLFFLFGFMFLFSRLSFLFEKRSQNQSLTSILVISAWILSLFSFNQALSLTLISSLITALILKHVYNYYLSSDEENLKEMISKDKPVWFFWCFSLTSLVAFPPSPLFLLLLTGESENWIQHIIQCLFGLIPLIYILLENSRVSKVMVSDEKLETISSLAFFLLFSAILYFGAANLLPWQDYQLEIVFQWKWFAFILASIAITLIFFFSNFGGLLYHFFLRRFKKKEPILVYPREISSLSFKKVQKNERSDKIIPKIPTQWAFLSWGLSLALGLGIIFMVNHGV